MFFFAADDIRDLDRLPIHPVSCVVNVLLVKFFVLERKQDSNRTHDAWAYSTAIDRFLFNKFFFFRSMGGTRNSRSGRKSIK